MLRRILRCKFCNREMAVGLLGYVENPYCSACLSERLERAAEKRGPGHAELDPGSGLMRWVPDANTNGEVQP